MIRLDRGGLPIYSWAPDADEGALQQAVTLSKLPFVFGHVALMPDTHFGFGVPIGSVFASKGWVIPHAVGVDIGCGMGAVFRPETTVDREALKLILGRLREVIPVGMNHHKENQDIKWMPPMRIGPAGRLPIVEEEYDSGRRQVGTLGGGNHFLEIQTCGKHIWLMVHSGSRNVGYRVANYYHKLAQAMNEERGYGLPKDLVGFPADDPVGQQYLREMRYCVRFAFNNRQLMLERAWAVMDEILGDSTPMGGITNIAHNYAAEEQHFGEWVWVHRKGATSAKCGEVGIIPGSQGTKSYIVSGLGNPDSFQSCSHGAGRRMGRAQAKKTLDLAEEQERLDSQGILHSLRGVSDLDEAPSAYKDIDAVMEAQKDLVEITVALTPLAVLKG